MRPLVSKKKKKKKKLFLLSLELLKAHFGVIPITPWLTAADALVGTGIKCSSVTFQQTMKATVECKMEACRKKKSK